MEAVFLDRPTALFPHRAHQWADMRFEDRLEVEYARARWDIGALGGQGEFAQQVAVEATHHRAPARIHHPGAGPGLRVPDKDLASVLIAEADHDDANPAFGRFPCGVQGEGVVVLAVGEEQDHPGEVPGGSETRRRLSDRLFEPGAASGDASHVYVVQHHAKETEVGRQRAEHAGAPRESDQTHLVAAQVGEQVPQFGLGPLQAIGRYVLGEHGTGNVEGDHDLGADPGRLDEFEAPLGAHQGDDDGQHGKAEQGAAEAAPELARTIHQPRLHGGADEAVEQMTAPSLEADQHCSQDKNDPKPVNVLRLGEAESRHGNLRRTLWASNVDRTIKASPVKAKLA